MTAGFGAAIAGGGLSHFGWKRERSESTFGIFATQDEIRASRHKEIVAPAAAGNRPPTVRTERNPCELQGQPIGGRAAAACGSDGDDGGPTRPVAETSAPRGRGGGARPASLACPPD